ncbi:MAG TPA: hypothetical protein VGT78_08905 [Rhizomicrobium sp.]|nr:hypothetical protein [Rhizomicrobium sp.]
MQPLRIFVSSPSDVNPERAAAARVIDRLGREFGGFFAIQAELWEQEPLRATADFQGQIPRPSEADIVLVVVWSRLGTRLAPGSFKGSLSGGAVTGTEWEFEDAARSFRERGVPDLLFYRKTARIDIALGDDNAIEQRREEKRHLDQFLQSWFFTETAEFKGAFSSFTTTHEFELIVEQHLRKLIQARVNALDVASAQAPPARWQGGSPFRGLEPFDVEHAGIFYGRSRARMEVREALTTRAAQGAAFVLLLGMSGSGKSSLVRAALIPDLAVPGMIEQVGLFRYALLRPSDSPADPLAALAEALIADSALPELESMGWNAARIAEQLGSAPEDMLPVLEEALEKAGVAAGLLEGAKARLLLAVDQLEELFTLTGLEPETRDRFINALHVLARSGTVWVIATMRSDMFHHLASAPRLAELAEGVGQYHLLPPQPSEISQIIREPASAAGLRFEIDPKTNVGLDEVLHEAMEDDPAALPLLEFTLDELFKTRTARGVLTYEAYNRLGGIEGALARRAEDVFAGLPGDTQNAFASVACALVVQQRGSGGGFAARRAPWSEFANDSARAALVDAFVAARLFVTDAGEGSARTIRVAHEALFRCWPRMREALERDAAFLVARERLATATERWLAEDRAPDFLLQEGRVLAEAEELLQTRGNDLDPTVQEFIATSAEAVHRRRTRGLRWARAIAAGFALIAIIAGGAGWFALQNRDAAEHARNEAVERRDGALRSESFFLAALSYKSTKSGDPVSGALLARAAMPREIAKPDRPLVNEARDALAYALASLKEERGVIRHSGDKVQASFFPNGTVGSIGGNDPLRLSRVPDGKEIAHFGDHAPGNAWINDDGSQIILLDGENLKFFDSATGKQTRQLPLAKRADGLVNVIIDTPLSRAALYYAGAGAELIALPHGRVLTKFGNASPVLLMQLAGKSLLWADVAGDLVLQNASDGGGIRPLVGHKGMVTAIALSPDLAASGGIDGTVRLWSIADGSPRGVFQHGSPVLNLQFSTDGSRIVSGGRDRIARMWDVKTGAALGIIPNLVDHSPLALSPDGKRLAVADPDGSIRIHDAATGALIQRLVGHTAAITALSFDAKGTLLLSSAADSTARIWQPDAVDPAPILGDVNRMLTMTGMTRGGQPYSGDMSKGVVTIWRDGVSRPPISIATNATTLLAVQADTKARIVAISAINKVSLWSLGVSGAQLIGALPDLGVFATSIAVSPDGNRVFATGINGAAYLLDGNAKEIGQLRTSPPLFGGMSADGSRVWLRGRGPNIWLRDGKTFAALRTIDTHSAVWRVFLSKDGRTLLSVQSDGNVQYWNGKTLEKLRSAGPEPAAFTQSGDFVAIGDHVGHVTIFDIARHTAIAALELPGGAAQSLALSPDGSVVAVQCADGGVRTWSVPAMEPVLSLPAEWVGKTTAFQLMAFSPDGKWLAIRWHEHQLRLWPVDHSVAALAARADKAVPRKLTDAERALLILSYD